MNYVKDLDAYFCMSSSDMKDRVADMNNNLVVLVLPCRDMKEELYYNNLVVQVLPCRDMKEELELYYNKMVVLVLPCRDMKEELYYNNLAVLVLPCRDIPTKTTPIWEAPKWRIAGAGTQNLRHWGQIWWRMGGARLRRAAQGRRKAAPGGAGAAQGCAERRRGGAGAAQGDAGRRRRGAGQGLPRRVANWSDSKNAMHKAKKCQKVPPSFQKMPQSAIHNIFAFYCIFINKYFPNLMPKSALFKKKVA